MLTTAPSPDALWPRVLQWVSNWPPILKPPIDTTDTDDAVPHPVERDTLIVLFPGRVAFWLLTKLFTWHEMSREDAARFILQREVRVRYTPLIVEMDRKTILNEIK